MFKIGILSILLFATVLFIPATSLANAQQYADKYDGVDDVYYENNRYYNEIQYNNDRNQYYENDEPVYEEYYYPQKDKKKEPPMILVKKDVLYCESFVNASNRDCPRTAGPESDLYLEDCTNDNRICNNVDENSFNIIVTDNIEFPDSEDSTKLTLNGEQYTVTEESDVIENEEFAFDCKHSGFDDGIVLLTFEAGLDVCVIFEGECSGVIQDGEQKECIVKNYIRGFAFG